MGLLWEICRLQPRRTQRSFGNGDFLSGRSSVPGSLWKVGRTSRVIHTGKPWGNGISLGRLHPGLENGKAPSRAGGLAANGSVRPWGAVGLAGQLRWRCAVRHGLCRRIDPGVQKPGLCDGWLGPAVRAGALQGGMPARCGCSQPPGAPGRAGGGSRTCGKGIAAAAALAYGVAGCASSSIG